MHCNGTFLLGRKTAFYIQSNIKDQVSQTAFYIPSNIKDQVSQITFFSDSIVILWCYVKITTCMCNMISFIY